MSKKKFSRKQQARQAPKSGNGEMFYVPQPPERALTEDEIETILDRLHERKRP